MQVCTEAPSPSVHLVDARALHGGNRHSCSSFHIAESCFMLSLSHFRFPGRSFPSDCGVLGTALLLADVLMLLQKSVFTCPPLALHKQATASVFTRGEERL